VYAGAYYARLLECLRDFFPALRHALGDATFDQFAAGYLQRYPPRSYTLDRLADDFVQFLDETRPPAGSAQSETVADAAFGRMAEFVVELARMEWSIAQVFDGPGWEADPPLAVESLRSISADDWPTTRLETAPCLRLLAFRFPVNDYFTAFRRGEMPAIPALGETWLALTRREYVVRRISLSRPQYELLAALIAGHTVGESIERAAELAGDLDRFAADLHAWFRDWTALGLFRPK
jgi:hypothetical protein